MRRFVRRTRIFLLLFLLLIPYPVRATNLFFQGQYYCNLTGEYAAPPQAIHVASIMLLTAGTSPSFSSGRITGGDDSPTANWSPTTTTTLTRWPTAHGASTAAPGALPILR